MGKRMRPALKSKGLFLRPPVLSVLRAAGSFAENFSEALRKTDNLLHSLNALSNLSVQQNSAKPE